MSGRLESPCPRCEIAKARIDAGRRCSTSSNERQESVTPCRKMTGRPSARPCSTYSSRTPVATVTKRGAGAPAIAASSGLPSAGCPLVADPRSDVT